MSIEPKSILIVDDQQDLLLIMEREFRRHKDFKIAVASSIDEAMRIIERQPTQLVISDIRLGVESGFTLTKMLRQQWPEIGVILISAYRSAGNHAQAKALDAVAFLEKPFTMAKLMAEVEAFFLKQAQHAITSENHPGHQPETEPLPNASSMNHFQIQDLVQLFCLNGRAVLILLSAEHGCKSGSIYIQRGQVLHAELGELVGEDAFQALLSLPEPNLSVKAWDRPAPQTITTKWEHLLLHAALKNDHGFDEFPNSQVG
jgi:DNA-binding response OmpR family regulator